MRNQLVSRVVIKRVVRSAEKKGIGKKQELLMKNMKIFICLTVLLINTNVNCSKLFKSTQSFESTTSKENENSNSTLSVSENAFKNFSESNEKELEDVEVQIKELRSLIQEWSKDFDNLTEIYDWIPQSYLLHDLLGIPKKENADLSDKYSNERDKTNKTSIKREIADSWQSTADISDTENFPWSFDAFYPRDSKLIGQDYSDYFNPTTSQELRENVSSSEVEKKESPSIEPNYVPVNGYDNSFAKESYEIRENEEYPPIIHRRRLPSQKKYFPKNSCKLYLEFLKYAFEKLSETPDDSYGEYEYEYNDNGNPSQFSKPFPYSHESHFQPGPNDGYTFSRKSNINPQSFPLISPTVPPPSPTFPTTVHSTQSFSPTPPSFSHSSLTSIDNPYSTSHDDPYSNSPDKPYSSSYDNSHSSLHDNPFSTSYRTLNSDPYSISYSTPPTAISVNTQDLLKTFLGIHSLTTPSPYYGSPNYREDNKEVSSLRPGAIFHPLPTSSTYSSSPDVSTYYSMLESSSFPSPSSIPPPYSTFSSVPPFSLYSSQSPPHSTFSSLSPLSTYPSLSPPSSTLLPLGSNTVFSTQPSTSTFSFRGPTTTFSSPTTNEIMKLTTAETDFPTTPPTPSIITSLPESFSGTQMFVKSRVGPGESHLRTSQSYLGNSVTDAMPQYYKSYKGTPKWLLPDERYKKLPSGQHRENQRTFTTFDLNTSFGANFRNLLPTPSNSVFQSSAPPNIYNSSDKECRTRLLPCPDTLNSVYPLNGYCDRYVSCEFGEPVIKTCPDGLHFNLITKSCDFPHNSFCNYQCPRYDGFFGIPGDCGGYFICKRSVPQYNMCPPKMHWDFNLEQCSFPRTSSCPMHCAVPNDVKPYDGECQSYIICLNGTPYYHRCPLNTKFDPEKKLCIPQHLVQCRDNPKLMTKFKNRNLLCEKVRLETGVKVRCQLYKGNSDDNDVSSSIINSPSSNNYFFEH